MYRYAVPLTFFLFAWQAVRATPAHLVMTMHALTFGVFSATPRLSRASPMAGRKVCGGERGEGGGGLVLIHTHTQMY